MADLCDTILRSMSFPTGSLNRKKPRKRQCDVDKSSTPTKKGLLTAKKISSTQEERSAKNHLNYKERIQLKNSQSPSTNAEKKNKHYILETGGNKFEKISSENIQISQNVVKVDILDNILEAFETNKQKLQKPQKDSSDSENEEIAACSSRQLPPTPVPGSYRPLNRFELNRTDSDNSMVKGFLEKKGLLERIIGYKMLCGRVEPYHIMRYRIDLTTCSTPEYNFPEYGGFEIFPSSDQECKGTPLSSTIGESNKHALQKKGPKTPPGSPKITRSEHSSTSSLLSNKKEVGDQQKSINNVVLSRIISDELKALSKSDAYLLSGKNQTQESRLYCPNGGESVSDFGLGALRNPKEAFSDQEERATHSLSPMNISSESEDIDFAQKTRGSSEGFFPLLPPPPPPPDFSNFDLFVVNEEPLEYISTKSLKQKNDTLPAGISVPLATNFNFPPPPLKFSIPPPTYIAPPNSSQASTSGIGVLTTNYSTPPPPLTCVSMSSMTSTNVASVLPQTAPGQNTMQNNKSFISNMSMMPPPMLNPSTSAILTTSSIFPSHISCTDTSVPPPQMIRQRHTLGGNNQLSSSTIGLASCQKPIPLAKVNISLPMNDTDLNKRHPPPFSMNMTLGPKPASPLIHGNLSMESFSNQPQQSQQEQQIPSSMNVFLTMMQALSGRSSAQL